MHPGFEEVSFVWLPAPKGTPTPSDYEVTASSEDGVMEKCTKPPFQPCSPGCWAGSLAVVLGAPPERSGGLPL